MKSIVVSKQSAANLLNTVTATKEGISRKEQKSVSRVVAEIESKLEDYQELLDSFAEDFKQARRDFAHKYEVFGRRESLLLDEMEEEQNNQLEEFLDFEGREEVEINFGQDEDFAFAKNQWEANDKFLGSKRVISLVEELDNAFNNAKTFKITENDSGEKVVEEVSSTSVAKPSPKRPVKISRRRR